MNEPKRSFDLRVSENVEALAISVAMALVLKFFVVEAYQIPTGSMQPTILGDRVAGIKDRIFADKLITMLRSPERWEVMIFRFPLDERRLYVKRIVGLPGETLHVQGGDIWIDGKIARKPDDVNESVLKRVYPFAEHGAVDMGRVFMGSGGVDLHEDHATFPADGLGSLSLRKPPVRDAYLHGYDADWGIRSATSERHAVPDIDLALTARLDGDDDALTITFDADDVATEFVLRADGGVARIIPQDGVPREVPFVDDAAFPVGEDVEIVARSVDRRLVLWVDGDEWLRYDDDTTPPRPDRPTRSDIRLAMSGAGTVTDVEVRRDIYYLHQTPHSPLDTERWEIPADSYFGMGDNTQNSHDSRTWQTMTYALEDGRQLTGFWFDAGRGGGMVPPDANPRRNARNGMLMWADTHGDEHEIWPHEVQSEELRAAPFINERYLLGKAVAVFWPVVDPFRWKLIK